MRSLRLKNFRSLVDTGRIELKPLTILVGANSSGKSSFLRFFPLLRQTYEARSASPLLWYGRDVDFGDFAQTVRRGAEPKEIAVEFEVLDRSQPMTFSSWLVPQEIPVEVAPAPVLVSLARTAISSTVLRENDGKTYTAQYTFSHSDDSIDMQFDPSGAPSGLSVRTVTGWVQDVERTYAQAYTARGELVPLGTKTGWPEHLSMKALGGRLMLKELIDVLAGRVLPDELKSLGAELTHFGLEPILNRSPSPLVGKVREELAKNPTLKSRLQSYDKLRSSATFIDSMHSELHAVASGCVYIGPFRAAPERFYRQQELSVSRMDPQGANLGMFLRALSADQLDAFSVFAANHIGFHVRLRAEGMNVAILLEDDGGQSYNLIDMGYGFSQVLPIVAQCWATASGWQPSERDPLPTLIAIEQPELHLHPHYQAKLADMFVGTLHAARATLPETPQLIVETHSDALVSRLGELVEAGKLASEDVVVLLFEQDHVTKGTTVRQSTFSPDGTLTNWPIGFFAP